MRKLATVRKIDAIRPILGADAIECAVVGGWNVVVKKGEYKAGDLAIYCEIDSWIPHVLAPFLSKGQEPREYNGVKGERLRTIKLRGVTSQGLLLPWTVGREGDDLTEQLGIQKWEAPIPANLAGEVRGVFPTYIPKTDQERIQNLTTKLNDWIGQSLQFEITEKLDGSSMTVYSFDGDEGVCSRNLNLCETENNSLWKVCRRDNLLEKIAGLDIALQGEIVGDGIQGNPYKLRGQQFYVFDIYDIRTGKYYDAEQRQRFCIEHNIDHVPLITITSIYKIININDFQDVEQILKFAEAMSRINETTEREGVVFKCLSDPSLSFKAISNNFLLKHQ